jgi:hypothetical protein
MTITLDHTYGIITPQAQLNCRQTSNQAWVPQVNVYSQEYSTEEIDSILTASDDSTSSFWKMRTWAHLAVVPRFCAMTFLPFDWTTVQTLLVRKNGEGSLFENSYAPYFPESDQKELGCISTTEKVHNIYSLHDLQQGLEDIDEEISSDVLKMLSCFVQDPTTHVLGLTYRDKSGEQKITKLWSKPKLEKS